MSPIQQRLAAAAEQDVPIEDVSRRAILRGKLGLRGLHWRGFQLDGLKRLSLRIVESQSRNITVSEGARASGWSCHFGLQWTRS